MTSIVHYDDLNRALRSTLSCTTIRPVVHYDFGCPHRLTDCGLLEESPARWCWGGGGSQRFAHRQADRILIEEAVIVPTVIEGDHRLVKPWLKGYAQNEVIMKYVIIEPH